MIINASQRCDICAFYSDWFYERIEEGIIKVRNPYYPSQIKTIELKKDNIDAMVFITKNPIPMLSRLDELIARYPICFYITITPYHKEIEPRIPDKKKIIEVLKEIASKIGKERVVLRYDPILLNSRYTIEYHEKAFEKLVKQIANDIDHVIISFVDTYTCNKKALSLLGVKKLTILEIEEIAKRIGEIGKKYQVPIQACAEPYSLEIMGIDKKACINQEYMEKVIGHPLKITSKRKLRQECHCIPTVDIGQYDCCPNFCQYCYANHISRKKIIENQKRNDKNSPFLLGDEN